MKTGVIVDAYSSGSLLAPEFKKKGYQVIHVRSTEHPDSAHANAPFRKEDFIADIYEEDKQKLAALLQSYHVSFVIPGIEPSIELADYLSETLGLPTNGTKYSSARRDKYEMVELIKKAGLHTAPQIKTASVDEMLSFIRNLPNSRIVLKPLRNAGSEDVFIVDNEKDAIAGFEKILRSTTHFGEENVAVCVQEFIEGEEYVVDTVSANGKIVVTDIWHHIFSPVNGLPLFYDYDILLSPDDPSVKELKEYTIKAVEALGITWGPSHPEIIDSPQGPTVVEINSRMGGAGLPKIARAGLGKAQVEYTVAAYTDLQEFERMAAEPKKLMKHCLWVELLCSTEGMIKSLDTFEAIRQLPSYYDLILEIRVGQEIKKTVSLATAPGFVLLAHESSEQLMKDYQSIRNLESNGLFDVE